MKIAAIVLFMIVSSGSATAVEVSASCEPLAPLCADPSIDLRSVPIGFMCRTSVGVTFERVEREGFGEAWKGPDGVIWSDRITRSADEAQEYLGEAWKNSRRFVSEDDLRGWHRGSDAQEVCAVLGADVGLPDMAAFIRAEAYRFREVLPHLKARNYWTSSPDPTYRDEEYGSYVYSFVGPQGDFQGSHIGLFNNVRCVTVKD